MSAPGWTFWLLSALVGALLLLPLPIEPGSQRWPALVSEIENLGHPIAFGLLAHIAFRWLRSHLPDPSASPYLWVLSGTALLGLLTEAAQTWTGRDPSWADFMEDLLGAMVALLLHARAEQTLPARRLAIGTGAFLAVAASITPMGVTLAAYAHRTLQEPLLWRDGSALFGRFTHWHRGSYAALMLGEPAPDWRNWKFLELDLETIQPSPMQVVVRVHDRLHNQLHEDRYNETFTLAAGTRAVLRIPLDRVQRGPRQRTLDMSEIAGVVVFAPDAAPIGDLIVHEIRLSR